MLRVENLIKRFDGPDGSVRALDGVSHHVNAGEFVAVHGPSGCGKTTLLLTAGGLLRPSQGRAIIAGEDPYLLSPGRRSALRAEKIGFVFQQFHLIPYLTVLENVLVPAIARRPCPDAPGRARELISHFNLQDRIRHVPASLSTGERQRAAMARALLGRPGLLLADEPTGNLDGENAEIVLAELRRFAESGGAVLLVTHDGRAAEHAHRTLEMAGGKLLAR